MTTKAAALDVVEKVIDTTDETVNTLERIPNLALNGTTRKQQILILTATAVSASVASGLVSHLFTKKLINLKAEKHIEAEVEAAWRHYRLINKSSEELKSPLTAHATYIGAVAEYDGSREMPSVSPPLARHPRLVNPPVVVTDPVEETANVFSDNVPIGQWSQEVEESKRTPEDPFVITKEEYFTGELDYEQETLTYYVGDDVLGDQESKAVPVHEVDLMVGESNLLRFGHGSGDPNVVYIRNPRLEVDYEIVKHSGMYAREVAGFIQHSDEGGRPRKFRRYDE